MQIEIQRKKTKYNTNKNKNEDKNRERERERKWMNEWMNESLFIRRFEIQSPEVQEHYLIDIRLTTPNMRN